ncbi:hypothetical protein LX36DRAFT_419509 [Colletotrichum falcatum]|nr:hypothetical protein LX36DRAFT_419509 [Colletotrichum falcatum]
MGFGRIQNAKIRRTLFGGRDGLVMQSEAWQRTCSAATPPRTLARRDPGPFHLGRGGGGEWQGLVGGQKHTQDGWICEAAQPCGSRLKGCMSDPSGCRMVERTPSLASSEALPGHFLTGRVDIGYSEENHPSSLPRAFVPRRLDRLYHIIRRSETFGYLFTG